MGAAEIRDREVLPHSLKANPHKSTFANMMLYLRCQVDYFAWKKWESPEALDAEREDRMEEKKKKHKKCEEGLLDLRRRTRESVTLAETEGPGTHTHLWDNGRRR